MEIVFYGPLGKNIPVERIGGAEKGCNREIELLQQNNILIKSIEKPTKYYGKIEFVKEYINCLRKIIQYLKRNEDAVFYMVGFYDKQIIFEWLLCKIIKRLGNKIIYEPKNGAMVKKYYSNGWLYKKMSNDIFETSKLIFCQGVEYKTFLEDMGFFKAIYMPNYLKKEEIKKINLCKDKKKYVFMYSGRLTKSKNIILLIEIFFKIQQRYQSSVLYIIGGGQDTYINQIRNKICELCLEKSVFLTGILAFDKLAYFLNISHFFLFPTSEEFEGHSNSLTEAMGFGVVPIASDNGFNRTVIGNNELIVQGYNVEEYVEKIYKIIDGNQWEICSKSVKERVEKYFIEDIVETKYIEEINKLFRT